MKLSEYVKKEFNINNNYIKTNIEEIDNLLDGGLTFGKMIELSGCPDVGKTSIVFDILENISDDKIIFYISTSLRSVNYLLSRKLDNKDNIYVLLSNKQDEIINLIERIINDVDLIIIDSVAEILTNNESKSMDLNIMQNIPELLQKINHALYGKNASIILVNHITYKNYTSIPKWNNYFERYCSIRLKLEIRDNVKYLKLTSHKTKPLLVERRVN